MHFYITKNGLYFHLLLFKFNASNPGWMGGAGDALDALLAHAERRTLEGQDHNVDPAVIAPVIAEFFKR
jgi:hypothetical protein